MGAPVYVPRIDRWSIKLDAFSVDPTTGYLTVDGTASRVGVLEYGLADGAPQDEWFELVPESTLRNDEFLAMMQSIPFTMGHPPVMLDSDNTGKYQVGSVKRAWVDGDDLRVTIQVTDADAIKAMKEGVRELSLGYHAKLDETPGKFRGRIYHASQVGRRPNHLAGVDFARAGRGAKVDRLDSAWAPRVDGLRISKRQDQTMEEVEIEIGGVRYKVPKAVADQLTQLQEKVASDNPAPAADGDNTDNPPPVAPSKDADGDDDDKTEDAPRGDGVTTAQLDARLDTFADTLLDKMDGRRRKDAQQAEARASLIERAKPALPESFKTDRKTTADIMAAAIVEAQPEFKPAVEAAKKDEKILTGLFEAALVTSRTQVGSPKVGKLDSGSQRDPVEAARLRQNQRRVDASKTTNVIGIRAGVERQAAEAAARNGTK